MAFQVSLVVLVKAVSIQWSLNSTLSISRICGTMIDWSICLCSPSCWPPATAYETKTIFISFPCTFKHYLWTEIMCLVWNMYPMTHPSKVLQIGGHHSREDFAVRGKEPKDEVQIYTWKDATLRELTDLVCWTVHFLFYFLEFYYAYIFIICHLGCMVDWYSITG